MIKGELVNLTALEKSDLPKLQEWRNNPDFRKYFREFRELTATHQDQWYLNKVVNDPSTLMFSVRSKKSGELIGCAGLCYINWVHRHADLSLYIGWRDSYIDSEGHAEDACKTLFSYGFSELGLNKLWTEIYSFDSAKFELYSKLGMKQDGLLRQNYWYDGKWWDSRIMSIVASDYFGK